MNLSNDDRAELNQGLAEAAADLKKADEAARIESTKIKNELGMEFAIERADIEHDLAADAKAAKVKAGIYKIEVEEEFDEIKARVKADSKSAWASVKDNASHLGTRIKDGWFDLKVWVDNNGQKVVWFMNKFAEAVFKRTKK